MIPADRSHLHVTAKTHPGMSGKNNEDRYAVSAYRLEGDKGVPAVFAVLSDGVGGHRAGEVASEIAVERISQVVAASDGSQPVQTLTEAIIDASQQIAALSESDAEKMGMGATCACVWIIDNRLYIAYVGDSRIYFLNGNDMLQISTDHTWVQEAIDAGMLSAEEAHRHPNAHVIRRYLGSRQTVEPDTRLRLHSKETDIQAQANQGMRLRPGDQVVLCTDGLTDLVNPEEIRSALKDPDKDQALSSLIDLANQRGGHDNITVIAIGMPAPVAETVPTIPIPVKRRWNPAMACLGTSTLVVILLALFAGAYFYLKHSLPGLLAPTAVQPAASSQPSAVPATDLAPTATATVTPTQPTPSPTVTHTASPKTPAPTLTPWPTSTRAP